MMGMLLGVAVLILVLSVMNGFARELEHRILGMVPHLVLYGEEPLVDWPAWSEALQKKKEVVHVAPITDFQGMLSANGQVAGAWISGIDPEQEAKISIVDEFMLAGDLNALDGHSASSFGIVIGTALAQQLGVWVGDKITLVMPEATLSPAGILPRFKRFEIVGIFEVGAELDGLMAYIHWQDAAKLLRHPNKVGGVRVQLTALFDAPQKTYEWVNDPELQTLAPIYGSNWTRTHGSLFKAIKMEKALIALLLTLIIAVAAFNIVSSLVMLVQDKKGDIAVLRTMGASAQWIRQVFLWQGMIIGIIGTALGSLLGIVLSLTIGDVVHWLENLLSMSLFNAYFINYLPSDLHWQDVVAIALSALTISFLATLYPARKAAMTPPAEALRYD